jgi:hypothetical protein
MSMMGGFDIVIELSRAKLLDLIKVYVSIAGRTLVPPFILPMLLNQSGSDRMDVKVNDLGLSLTPGTSQIILIAQFQNSNLSVGGVTVTGLSGSATVQTSLLLQGVASSNPVPGAPGYKALGMDLKNNQSQILFERDSQTELSSQLGVSAEALQQQAGQALHDLIAATPFQSFPQPPFAVAPGNEGALSPGLIFERLDQVVAITDQVIGLFGILLPTNDANGNVAEKTTAALDAEHDVCVSIGPAAFRRLIFCDAAAKKLAKERMGGATSPQYLAFIADNNRVQRRQFIDTQLTGCCGTAAGIDSQGATITRLCDTLADGHVSVDTDVAKSGFCYSATGSSHSELYFSFNVDHQLVTTQTPATITSLDVDVNAWCKALVVVTGGLLGSIAWGGIAAAVSDALADALGQSLVGAPPADKPRTQNLSGFPNATFDAARPTPEGLTLQATLSVVVPPPALPTVELIGSIARVGQTYLIGQLGVYHYPGSKVCKARDFEYEVHSQSQQATYSAVATNFGPPLTLEWSLEHHRGYYGVYDHVEVTDVVTLSGPGPWSINVDLSFPAPPLLGTVMRDFPLGLSSLPNDLNASISGNTFTLTTPTPYISSDDHGQFETFAGGQNFTVYLTVRATDSSGLTLTAQEPLPFLNCWRDMDVAFGPYMHHCELLGRILISHLKTDPQGVPLGGDRGRPPESLVEEIQKQIMEGSPGAEGLMAAAEAIFGSQVIRAVHGGALSPSSVAPPKSSRG